MIPDSESDFFTEAVGEAISRAFHGRLSDGGTLLLNGFKRAEILLGNGEPWVAELVLRWALACENYAESFGVRMA